MNTQIASEILVADAELQRIKQLTQFVEQSYFGETVDWEHAFFELAMKSQNIRCDDVAEIIANNSYRDD